MGQKLGLEIQNLTSLQCVCVFSQIFIMVLDSFKFFYHPFFSDRDGKVLVDGSTEYDCCLDSYFDKAWNIWWCIMFCLTDVNSKTTRILSEVPSASHSTVIGDPMCDVHVLCCSVSECVWSQPKRPPSEKRISEWYLLVLTHLYSLHIYTYWSRYFFSLGRINWKKDWKKEQNRRRNIWVWKLWRHVLLEQV